MHHHFHYRAKKGHVILMSVLITSAIVLQLTVLGLQHFVRERQLFSAFQNKRQSRIVATGCMEHAVNTLGRLPTYTGNEVYAISGTLCSILPITHTGETWTLQVSTTIGMQTTHIVTTLSSRAPVIISSWQEAIVSP